MSVEGFLNPQVCNLNFDCIKSKMSMNLNKLGWDQSDLELAEREYRRFLTLIVLNPGKAIVPTKLVDEFWHQHILDTQAYGDDCHQVFGAFVHHYPYFGINGKEDKLNLDKTFEETQRLYLEQFKEVMPKLMASRCEGHACHVESDCACRVSGACKNM